MTRHRQRGAALLAALATLAFAAALVAALTELVRTELRLTSERRLTSRLLAALDACLADVVAELPAGWDFASELAGADGVAGTSDDGVLPAPDGCTARAVRAPGAAEPGRALIRVEASIGGARRSLEALVRRAAEAGAGALVWLSAPPEAGAVPGLASFDGAHPSTPLASLAAPAAPETLDAWMGTAGTLEVTPGTTPPLSGPAPPLAELGARVQASSHAGPEALVPSGETATLIHVGGDLAVDDARRGAGLLFVEGVLEVRGLLEFAGVVAATGGIRLAAGGTLALEGSLWLGAGAPALAVDGTLALRHVPAALTAADALLPLPRRAAVASVRDLG